MPSSVVQWVHPAMAPSMARTPVAAVLLCAVRGLKEGNAPCETVCLHLLFFPPSPWVAQLLEPQ